MLTEKIEMNERSFSKPPPQKNKQSLDGWHQKGEVIARLLQKIQLGILWQTLQNNMDI